MNSLSKTAVRRPVTILMCVLAAVAFGIISIGSLKLDLYPNMNIPVVLVMTSYDGVGSEEIEKLITEPIESAVGTVSGLDELSSTTSNGSSMVMIQFDSDTDIDTAASDVREYIDLVKGRLPDDANEPMILKIDPNSMTSLSISVSSDKMNINDLKSLVENELSDRFERQGNVSSVSVMGGQEKEYRVILQEDKIRGYGISETTVTNMLAAENSNTPMGSIEQGDKNLTIRVKGEFKDMEEVKNIPFTLGNGSIVYLRDFADIEEVYKEASSESYTNGKPSIQLAIRKTSTGNTVDMSEGILKELAKMEREYPDIDFLVINDPADQINSSISNVVTSALQGAVFAVIVLYLFLRNFKSTLVVGLAMPISIITTIALMYFTGMTLNLMSLGGLTLGIGMLVDNAIVVLESIYKKLEEGVDRKTAASEGAREVGTAIFASTLTTVAVFLPIPVFGGMAGELFTDLSLTITYSLTSSLIVALTFVPMCASVILRPENATANVHKRRNIFTAALDFVGYILSALEAGYKFILDKALKRKKITVLIMVGFVILTGSCFSSVGMDFMPSSDAGMVSISIDMPTGSKLEPTSEITWKIINIIDECRETEFPEIKNVSFSTGGGSGMSSLTGGSEDTASISIELVDKENRERTSADVARAMKPKFKDIAGADIEVTESGGAAGRFSGGGVTLNILGDETERLQEIADGFVELMETIPGLTEVKTSLEEAAPQTTINIDRNKASAYGITSSAVAGIVRTAVYGSVATTYKIDGDEYDIRVMHDNDKINYIKDVESILIPTSGGATVPLSELATITSVDTPTTITRDNQQRYVSVTANLDGIDLGTANTQIKAKLDSEFIMPDGYSYEFGGNSEEMGEAFGALGNALLLAILLVYMIMAAQFEAFSYPLMIMGAMPIAMTGGIFGLFIAGESLSMTGFLGLIMLAGVVVNNAIVLVDYANLLIRERDLEYTEAMKVAGPARLRPILMSTLTTVLGMLPMMLSTKEGAEMMTGLATVMVYGLTLSTLITLIFIPTIYVGYNNIKVRRRKRKEKRRARRAERKLAKINKEK